LGLRCRLGRSYFSTRINQPAESYGREHERHRQLRSEHGRAQVRALDGDGVARSKRHFFKRTAILPQRNFAFGASVDVVEDRSRQMGLREAPQIADIHYTR